MERAGATSGKQRVKTGHVGGSKAPALGKPAIVGLDRSLEGSPRVEGAAEGGPVL